MKSPCCSTLLLPYHTNSPVVDIILCLFFLVAVSDWILVTRCYAVFRKCRLHGKYFNPDTNNILPSHQHDGNQRRLSKARGIAIAQKNAFITALQQPKLGSDDVEASKQIKEIVQLYVLLGGGVLGGHTDTNAARVPPAAGVAVGKLSKTLWKCCRCYLHLQKNSCLSSLMWDDFLS